MNVRFVLFVILLWNTMIVSDSAFSVSRRGKRIAMVTGCMFAWQGTDLGFNYYTRLAGSLKSEFGTIQSWVNGHPDMSLLGIKDQKDTIEKLNKVLHAVQNDVSEAELLEEAIAADLQNINVSHPEIDFLSDDTMIPRHFYKEDNRDRRSQVLAFIGKHVKGKLESTAKNILIEGVLNSVGSCTIGHELGYIYKYYKAVKSLCKGSKELLGYLKSRMCQRSSRGVRASCSIEEIEHCLKNFATQKMNYEMLSSALEKSPYFTKRDNPPLRCSLDDQDAAG